MQARLADKLDRSRSKDNFQVWKVDPVPASHHFLTSQKSGDRVRLPDLKIGNV